MTTELWYLSLTAGFTSLMWVPYILNAMAVRGVMATLGNPRADAPDLSPWAARAKRAHANAIENLVVFAALVLVASATPVSNDLTVGAAAAYFWSRVAYHFIYIAGIPVLRTLSFLVGFGCQIALASQLLA